MWKTRIWALLLLIIGAGIGYFIYASEPKLHEGKTVNGQAFAEKFPFRLGLDLSGGVQLVYQADVTSVKPGEVKNAMDSLRDVIERRVNTFGVSEPIVQIEEKGGITGPVEERLLVELPGITDVKNAVAMIGQTPKLEFMTERSKAEIDAYNKAIEKLQADQEAGKPLNVPAVVLSGPYQPTELNGRFLERAVLEFDQTTREPIVSIVFNKQGSDLFAELTKANVGKTIAIYLDREMGNPEPISAPVVRETILGGKAQITGKFTAIEAKTLVGRLNSGALPVDKLELLSTQTISAPLGAQALTAGIWAGVWGLVIVAVFLVLWYRLPGLVSVVALAIYVVMMLTLFKFFGVTLTAAGIAGFILSIGMAVDANILIFERTKEELRKGHGVHEAIREGFARAWTSIRDSNISSIITAVILFWFGTSLIKGFALTFGIGVIVSMLTAISISRTLLFALPFSGHGSFVRALFGSGFIKLK
ncbi:MAG: protein translocase subunit SecD [Candidatus Yonathbacteria bacterium CG_4_10_14_0_8_um_filter_43_17]|uniref:Protein translocase subunit SecD n=1 Tax=Candidatus Yonathbacteria bacterium CG_4_10_14_0_8_um_filter_43_17 TaxID=1975099 RepID=A0A2M7Q3Z7_9BACT|nr:MAG: protein translocase subunit SecD [Candidatus Yonathbacteria bacterium CG_4_10_14_0_8_um_filter_43_17]